MKTKCQMFFLVIVLCAWAAGEVAPLRRGVNLSHWLSQTRLPNYPPNPVSSAEMRLIRSIGLDHVRLPVDPVLLWDFSAPGELQKDVLKQMDHAVELALEHDLNVVVDMHPRPNVKKQLESAPIHFRSFVVFWEQLAAHLAKTDPNRVALELLNEPLVKDTAQWQAMAETLYTAVRRAAPQHTIILGGAEWSDVFMLRNLRPLDDPNIIYTFHFYEPHLFTHQGARWGSPEWLVYTNVPYPMPPEVGSNMMASVTNESVREAMFVHIEQDWNADKIESRINMASEWAAKHGATIWCGEFGAYRPYMGTEDRARYINDVRNTLERHGIGWTLWDFKGSFSLLEKEATPPKVDAPIGAALGLPVGEDEK